MMQKDYANMDDEIDLIEYLKVIWRYKWFVVITTFLVLVITFFVTRNMPPVFSSSISFISPQEEGMGGNIAGMLGGMGFGDLMSGGSTTELLMEIVKSRRMAEDAAHHFGLKKHYDGTLRIEQFMNKLGGDEAGARGIYSELRQKGYIDDNGKVTDMFDPKSTFLNISPKYIEKKKKILKVLRKAHPFSKEIQAVQMLQKSTKVETAKSGLIKVTIDDISPIFAANIANYMVANLDKMNEDLQITTKKPIVQVLDSALIPMNKSKPKLKANLVIAGITAVFATIFISFFIEYILQAVYSGRKVK